MQKAFQTYPIREEYEQEQNKPVIPTIMKVSWIPRRHRSLVYKLLILIPIAWLTIAFLYYNGKEGGNALPNALQQHQSSEDEATATTNAKIEDRYSRELCFISIETKRKRSVCLYISV